MPETKRIHRRLFKAIAFLALTGLVMALLVYSPLFVLREVKVQGNTYLSVDDVCQIGKIYSGEPLFKLQTDEVTRNLLRDLRIEDATVKRSFPSALDVQVKERMPVVTVACDYGYLDLDRRGKVIDSYRTLKNMPIPMVTGITMHDMYIGDDNEDEQIAKVLFFLEQLDSESLNQISEISLADPEHIVAYTTASVQVRLGKLERLEDKAELTKDFLRDLRENQPNIEYVDFNYKSPFVKMKQQ